MTQAWTIGATTEWHLFVLEWTQHKPDERQSREAQRDGAQVVGGIVKLDGFVADIVGRGATQCGGEVLPQVVARNALRTLQEKHNEAGEDNDCRPVVRCFHRFSPQIPAFSTIYSLIVPIVMVRTLKKNLLVSFALIAGGGLFVCNPTRRLLAGAA